MYVRVVHPHDVLAVTGLFDRASGVLKACSDKVSSFEVFCYGAPASDPVECICPGSKEL